MNLCFWPKTACLCGEAYCEKCETHTCHLTANTTLATWANDEYCWAHSSHTIEGVGGWNCKVCNLTRWFEVLRSFLHQAIYYVSLESGVDPGAIHSLLIEYRPDTQNWVVKACGYWVYLSAVESFDTIRFEYVCRLEDTEEELSA